MKNKRFSLILAKLTLIGALAALIIFSFGCSKFLPTSPEPGKGQFSEDIGDDDSAPPEDDLWCDELSEEWTELRSADATGWFGQNGAVVTQVVNFQQLQFRVPPGALEDSAYISVHTTLLGRNWLGECQKKLEFVFEPDGLVFSVPAQIMFKAMLLDVEKDDFLALQWFNPETGLWETEETVKVNGSQLNVTFEISHFSRYAISRSNVNPSIK